MGSETIGDDAIGIDDSFALHTPRWLNTLVATIAEAVLIIVTIGIITAMWLPAYLTSRQPAESSDHNHQEEMIGMFPRGK